MLFHGLPYGKGIENVKDITRKYESHHVCLLSLSTRATFSLGRSLSLSAPQGIRGTEENRKHDRSRCLAALLESSCQKQSLSLCKINLHINCTGWISPLFLLGMLHDSISGLTSINDSCIPGLLFLLPPHPSPLPPQKTPNKQKKPHKLTQITVAIPMPYLRQYILLGCS